MSQNSFNTQNVIFFVCLACSGMAIIGFCCSDLYHWFLTGDLWVHPKYSHGWYTTYSEAPGLFIAAFGKQVLLVAGGLTLVAFGIVGPTQYRKQQQARLQRMKKYPPHPWPSRATGAK